MPAPSDRPFRFGVALHVPTTRKQWVDKCRLAESLGYGTIAVADHLGMPAPFPALVLAAEATERPRMGTFVLNSNFYRPALAIRDITTTNLLTDGRLELGLGAGHAKSEFDEAGLPFPRGADRVSHLEQLISELNTAFAEPPAVTSPHPSRPPLLVAGRGDRLLELAAREADIIGFNGAMNSRHQGSELPTFASATALDERVRFARTALGERIHNVEFNITAPAVTITDNQRAVLEGLDRFAPSLTVAERAEVPGFLIGTPAQIAEKLRANRERFGFTYITVLEANMEPLAKVIELLKEPSCTE